MDKNFIKTHNLKQYTFAQNYDSFKQFMNISNCINNCNLKELISFLSEFFIFGKNKYHYKL